jgi:hypothetical protein
MRFGDPRMLSQMFAPGLDQHIASPWRWAGDDGVIAIVIVITRTVHRTALH